VLFFQFFAAFWRNVPCSFSFRRFRDDDSASLPLFEVVEGADVIVISHLDMPDALVMSFDH
jgi:hypothetical protein